MKFLSYDLRNSNNVQFHQAINETWSKTFGPSSLYAHNNPPEIKLTSRSWFLSSYLSALN